MTTDDLLVVLPVYNEEASVRRVIVEWIEEIGHWTHYFKVLVINDGSTDGTGKILQNLAEEFADRLEILNQGNAGHGQACLRGYRMACERGISYVLQIDSDGQCDPRYFGEIWKRREDFDVIYGSRRVREDGWQRAAASVVLKVVLLIFARVYCVDANTPYRLMRVSRMYPLLGHIPDGFFLVNTALAVLFKRKADLRHGKVPIRFRQRYAGKSTVPPRILMRKAIEFIAQLHRLRYRK